MHPTPLMACKRLCHLWLSNQVQLLLVVEVTQQQNTDGPQSAGPGPSPGESSKAPAPAASSSSLPARGGRYNEPPPRLVITVMAMSGDMHHQNKWSPGKPSEAGAGAPPKLGCLKR
jgi:hypothetical protein